MMQKFMFPRSLCLLVLFASACGPASQTKSLDDEALLQQQQQATQFIDSGDFLAAADAYLALAEADGARADEYRLKAAAALVEAADYNRAEEILTLVEKDDEQTRSLQKTVLIARIALARGDARTAVETLGPEPVDTAPGNLKSAWYDVKAAALEQLGLWREALSDRLMLSTLPGSPAEHSANNVALWQLLEKLDNAELEAMRTSDAPVGAGWSELALIFRTHMTNPKNLKLVLEDWSARYPDHGALAEIVPGLIASSEELATRPQNLALLLPFSGRFADASRAIRDGFVAAWYDSDDANTRIRFYNTDSLNIIEQYQNAVSEGADFIIGPLEKTAIDRLLQQGSITTKTMVLNYFDGDLNNAAFESVKPGVNFFQLTLSPEDEAMQVAERAWFDGHARALAISTGDEWGNRVLTAFRERWQELGGVLLEHAVYDSETEDYSEPIRGLLNTDSSKERTRELRAVLNRSIHGEERRRQDADFIFIASPPDIARQVMPHIRFLRAGDLPVYATSHVYSGQPDPVRDADMNRILFADVPWTIDPDFYHDRAKSVIGQTWPQSAANYQRLYALGYDAYSVIPGLPGLAADSGKRFSGATGNLYVADQGRIQHYLAWAQFVDGLPQPVDGGSQP